jgi:hypothetical protein
MKTKSGSQHYPGFLHSRNSADGSIRPGIQADAQGAATEMNALAVLLPEFLNSAAPAEQDEFRLIPGSQPLVRAARLVVLIPDIDFDAFELVRRVWRMALPGRLSVLFIALATDEQSAARFHQRLTNLAFLIADPRLRVAKIILTGLSWPAALRRTLQTGDLPVCLDGLLVRKSIFQKQNLAILAASQTSFAVLELLNIPVENTPGLRQPLTSILAWACSALTMAGFGFVQMRLTLQTNGWTLNIFLILSMILEFLLIFKINTWIN